MNQVKFMSLCDMLSCQLLESVDTSFLIKYLISESIPDPFNPLTVDDEHLSSLLFIYYFHYYS